MGGSEVEFVSDRDGLAGGRDVDFDYVRRREAMLGGSADDQRRGVPLVILMSMGVKNNFKKEGNKGESSLANFTFLTHIEKRSSASPLSFSLGKGDKQSRTAVDMSQEFKTDSLSFLNCKI